MSPRFFQTMMGKSFFENNIPRLIKALEDLARELKRYNDNCEKSKIEDSDQEAENV